MGIGFIMIMLAMAVGMPDTLNYYKNNSAKMMMAKYQYVLKSTEDKDGNVISTDNSEAEKFCMKSLLRKTESFDEEVSVYGIKNESRYVMIDDLNSFEKNEVYISEPFSDKYGLVVGDTITLDEKYENKKYDFKIVGVYDKIQSIAIFMSKKNYASVFDLEKDEFSGYLSDSKITDIDNDNIATVITVKDIMKMCNQLDHSMGAYMEYFQVLCIFLSAVLIYLLTKLIIEKNENAISMTKILGYKNTEIASLYLMSTTFILVLIDVVSVGIGVAVMRIAWKIILADYSGWFAFHLEPTGYIKMFVFVLVGYLIVMVFDFMRIKNIPMEQALKNVE